MYLFSKQIHLFGKEKSYLTPMENLPKLNNHYIQKKIKFNSNKFLYHILLS